MQVCIILALLLASCTHIECKKKNKCKILNGLACDSLETLKTGSVFEVESKRCKNGRYPKKENCNWYFDVDNCFPMLSCKKIDIKGKGKRCKGDKLAVTTNVDHVNAKFCGKKKNITFSPTTAVSKFDVSFTTNKKGQKKGFKCVVSCEGVQQTTTVDPPTIGDCECGIPNRVKRIVGGIETEVNEYPWQAGLAFTRNTVPFCGGSILSSTIILTAAHCTADFALSEFEVIIGDHDVTVDDGQERFTVCKKLEHPGYDSGTNDNDLSILTLCSPVVFTKVVGPVCLPTLPGPQYDNVLSTVSGWGTLYSGGRQPDKLLEVNVTTIPNNECNLNYTGDILDSMICAKGDGKDACQGDSGGPLVTQEQGKFSALIGVVSWGYGCARSEYPGVYARVTENMQFISTNMAGKVCKLPISGEEPVEMTTAINVMTTITGEQPIEMTTKVKMTTTELATAASTTTSTEASTKTSTEASTRTTTIESTTTTTIARTTTSTTETNTATLPSPSNCECGLPNRVKRIVGGIETEQNEYPWQVGIASPFRDAPFCGGSILSSTTILTATHCTIDTSVSALEVIVGDHDVTLDDGEERFKVCSKTEHPEYDDFDTANDLCILTLCTPLIFRKEVKPVCLPEQPESAYENIAAIVSGWGTLTYNGVRSNILMGVNVTTMSNVECNKAYDGDILESMICAADAGKDGCQGDSGGPLVAKEDGPYYSQIGVTSWGIGCADPDFPGVYARVTQNLDFIKKHLSGKTCDKPV